MVTKTELLAKLDASFETAIEHITKVHQDARQLIEASFPEGNLDGLDTTNLDALESGIDHCQKLHVLSKNLMQFSQFLYKNDGLLRQHFSPVLVPGGTGKVRTDNTFKVYVDDASKMTGQDLMTWPGGFYRDKDSLDVQLLIHLVIDPENSQTIPFLFTRLDEPCFTVFYPANGVLTETQYRNGELRRSHPDIEIPEVFFAALLKQIESVFWNLTWA